MPDPIYCAPAARPLTRLHIPEDGADLAAPYGAEGLTRCGLVMVWAEVWVAVARRPGDYICGPCLGEAEPQAQQLTLSAPGAIWPHADRNAPSNAGGMA